MKAIELIKKHFKNINLTDYYFEKYYQEKIRFFYKSYFCDLKDSCKSDIKYGKHEIIVSLTTYGARAYTVYLTIISLIHQTIKANKIVLWLSEKEFNTNTIPLTLRKLQEHGLDIRFCEDIKSYKKIIPTIKEFPYANIITVDDDIIYPSDLIERLISAHLQYPNKVCFTRGCNITFDKNGNLLPYKQWLKPSNIKSMTNIPTGIGGILYPKDCFHKDVSNKELFMKLCPNADDLWLRTMCLLNEIDTYYIDCYKNFSHFFIEIEYSQENSLSSTNNGQQSTITNDTQFEQIINHYHLKSYIHKL